MIPPIKTNHPRLGTKITTKHFPWQREKSGRLHPQRIKPSRVKYSTPVEASNFFFFFYFIFKKFCLPPNVSKLFNAVIMHRTPRGKRISDGHQRKPIRPEALLSLPQSTLSTCGSPSLITVHNRPNQSHAIFKLGSVQHRRSLSVTSHNKEMIKLTKKKKKSV